MDENIQDVHLYLSTVKYVFTFKIKYSNRNPDSIVSA